MIIDPPSPLDTLDVWADFRREMESLAKANPGDAAVAEWLAEARRVEALKQAA